MAQSANSDVDVTFAAWIRPLVPAMSLLATRLAPGDHEDVVQEAIIRAWQKWHLFDPARGTPKSWVLAIVADRARRRLRRLRVITDPIDDSFAVPDPSGRVLVELQVNRAVGSLPRKQRLAVECYYYLGLDLAETAQVLHVSVGTIKSNLAAARRALRSLLAPSEAHHER